MRILLVNHYAGGPRWGMEHRPYHLAHEWVAQGHAVQIVAANFSHVRAQQPAAGDIVEGGVPYRFLPTPGYRGNGAGRVLNIAAFLAQVRLQAGHWARWKPDAVIASSTYPLDVPVVRTIARKAGAVWCHEVHDLWPLSPIELSGMSPTHPFIRACQWAEDLACREADVVVSMLPKVQQHMAAHGLADPERLAIVPNGVVPDDWAQPAPELRADIADRLDRWRSEGRVLVGHPGSMGLPNALDHLLDAARRLKVEADRGSAPRFGFLLVGDGHERERLVKRIADEGLQDSVAWFPPIPKAQVRNLLGRLDLGYLGWQRVPIYRFGIAPNKLMDYLMAGLPVLHSVEAGNDPVAEAGAGLTVAPEDPRAIAEGLLALARTPTHERRAMGERGRAFVLAHHAYPVLAERFVQALEGARQRAARARR